jgi:hypothetical protein
MSASQCVAVDLNGHVMTTTDAGAGGTSWSTTRYPNPQNFATLSTVSCPSVSLCVALDDFNGLLVSTNPLNSANWTRQVTPQSWRGVSCTITFCVAVSGREVFYTAQPTSAPNSWAVSVVGPPSSGFGPVVCTAAPMCVAGVPSSSADGARVFTTIGPAAGVPGWQYDAFPVMTNLTCATAPSLLCTASHSQGDYIEASTDPAGGASTWGAVSKVGGQGAAVRDVSCASSQLCVAAMSNGYAVAGIGTGFGSGGAGGSPGTPAGTPVAPTGPLFGTPYGGVVIPGGSSTYIVSSSGFTLPMQVASPSSATISAQTLTAANTAKKVAAPRLAVAKVTVKLRANVRTRVRLKLTKLARKLLAKQHKLKIAITIVARSDQGSTKTTTKRLTLVTKQPKRKKS